MVMVKDEEVRHVLIVQIVETSCWKPARVVDKGKFEKSTKYKALSKKYLKKKTTTIAVYFLQYLEMQICGVRKPGRRLSRRRWPSCRRQEAAEPRFHWSEQIGFNSSIKCTNTVRLWLLVELSIQLTYFCWILFWR